jgi:hypothetical protein
VILLITGAMAYFAGGFVAGMIWCKGCEGIGSRIFIGIVILVLSAFTGCFPPQNEGGVGPSLNTWPYIFACWGAFFVAALIWKWAQWEPKED